MSRVIKFRAWDIKRMIFVDGGEVVFRLYPGEESNFYVVPNSINYIGDECHQGDYLPGRFVIDQFTGHKDRNGVDIYEGDLIRRYSYVYLVVWCDETSRLGYTCVGRYAKGCEGEIEAITSERSPFNFSDDTRIVNEVIGNIHQNPDLLKKVKQL